MSDINTILEDTSSTMNKAISHLESELTKIRAGKAQMHAQKANFLWL
jgi:ribosome recycling factor